MPIAYTKRRPGVVLIVDDAPENLAMLHEALDLEGYLVMVATGGQESLDRVAVLMPDLILLDAIMPGIDGFETCRRLKSNPLTAHIPVVFMTGLCETGHILAGFRAGGVDYLTKPLNPPEVMVRIASHLRNASQMASARRAVEASGHAMLSTDLDGLVFWQSPLAQIWLREYLTDDGQLQPVAKSWLTKSETEVLLIQAGGRNLSFSRLTKDSGGFTLLLRKRSSLPDPPVLSLEFGLTIREAEVLYWVTFGKINRDVAQILSMSTRTVDKHLQHVFEKLHVETRTGAASVVLNHSFVDASLS